MSTASGPVEEDAGALRALGGCCGQPAPLGSTGAISERWARDLGDGRRRVELLVRDVSCAACIARIERGLAELEGVETARVNLSLRRVGVEYRADAATVASVARKLEALGYPATPFDAATADDLRADSVGRDLLSRLAVAGFAAANVMLLSVSVWTGAEDATRDLMHWLSGLIALPAAIYAGRPFYRSAWGALSHGRLNMDVPISLAVLLALGVSLAETAQSGAHAYFDAAVSLLFFLLIGRYLDHRARGAARSAAAELAVLSPSTAVRILDGGRTEEVATDDLAPGDLLLVTAGARLPADGVVESGESDLDRSMVTGEETPEVVGAGASVHAGMTNLTGPLQVRVTAVGAQSLLAEIQRLIEAAERNRNRYTRLADRAAAFYAPGVHIIAAIAFLGWMIATGGDWRAAIMTAAAVLIITCPCALGLAVPAVQAAASGALFRRGVLLKSADALEKLAEVNVAVFDKTGTLTQGRPRLVAAPADLAPEDQALAASLARRSRHPLARALAEAFADAAEIPLRAVVEKPGLGVEALVETPDGPVRARLGRSFDADVAAEDGRSRVWLHSEGRAPLEFAFEDAPRPDAAAVVARLDGLGLAPRLLSGDRVSAVAKLAQTLGIRDWRAGQTPADKLAALSELEREGRKTLMVGDGVNDAPALSGAYVSMSPASAADVSRASADLVFTGESLAPVLTAARVARSSRRRVLENFGLAAIYNMVAIPLAVFGFVTPLVAALAMSGSSIIVTLNALRVRAAARQESFAGEP